MNRVTADLLRRAFARGHRPTTVRYGGRGLFTLTAELSPDGHNVVFRGRAGATLVVPRQLYVTL